MWRIEYRDEFNVLYTEAEIKSVNDYRKLYLHNDVLVKEELFEDNKLTEGVYYLGSGELFDDIVHNVDPSLYWIIRGDRQVLNGCEIWHSRHYIKGKLSESYFIEVLFDSKLIASRSYFPDGLRMPGSAYKILYLCDLFQSKNAGTYSFYFDKEDRIKLIVPFTEDGRDRPYEYLSRFLTDEYIVTDLTPEQLYYFTHADPLVPDDKLF